jgi:hypothetical protein
MATTTTNFGWDIPQSTDLVKDGATAIAALGQDIDTAMVDLKGGTTGQVLAKASGTDLDFSWVAQDDSNAIQNAIVDAKGDLISATAADTPARLAVGTDGHVLTADSTTATGLKWAAAGGAGKVLQVIQATYSTQVNVSSTTYTDTGLSVSITPSSASSRVMIIATHSGTGKDTSDTSANMRLMRDATSVGIFAAIHALTGSSSTNISNLTISYVDSPATTSAVTYKTQINSSANSAKAFTCAGGGVSTIIAMEIGA